MKEFDYIIVGGGASGLQLADALGSDPYFGNTRIGLFERQTNKGNDRTWCFWEPGSGKFDALLTKSWDHIRFRGPDFERTLALDPYRYKMLRGEDFYREFYRRIGQYPNVELRQEEVRSIEENGDKALVKTTSGEYTARLVFSSVSFAPVEKLMKPFPVLQQHFLGWFVRCEKPVFDPGVPTFMDFSIPQKGNTRFMYVLPESPTEALVEYTLFSDSFLETREYEEALKGYMVKDLGDPPFEILEKEQGSIPMTVNDFTAADSPHLIHIGIAGGWAKASTGYTFWSTSQKVPRLVAALKKGKPLQMAAKSKFWYYDRLMLDVLARENEQGSQIFSMLFRNLSPQLIFKFLHEQTSLAEDFRIINSCPKAMFMRAFWKALIRSPY
ncbi:MAG: lycopene cyclase family protein [Robiginitalea sp.]